MSNERPRRNRRVIVALAAALSLLLVCSVAGTGYVLWQSLELDRSSREAAATPKPGAVRDTPLETAENPIDFLTLQSENNDIFAWIYIPGTEVNYPVLKHPTDDSFYLDHNKDGAYAIEGSIYEEIANSSDFSDPVTVLYGHNLVNGTMFSSLCDFEDASFFDAHDTFHLYTPHRILTYRIIAAYVYDDRHIIKTNNFTDPINVQAYFDSVLHPADGAARVRAGAQLGPGDKIVQLSTCTSPTDDTASRYIVTGELVDEQPTS